MRTANPAFRNLPSGGGYAQFNYQQAQPGYAQPGYGYPQPPQPAAERPITVDDVVLKSATTLGVAVIAGVLAAALKVPPGVVFGGAIVGFVLALIVIFRQSSNPALILSYSAAEGIFLGGLSRAYESVYNGIILQAVIGTAGVFIGMLVAYKTGAIRVTPKLTRWIIGATIGVAVLMLANLILSFFVTGGIGIRNGGGMAIVFSIIVIGIAAFNLLLDFDMADQLIRSGAPAKTAWYAAFGLMVTIVWLYIEILRLLSYLQRD